MGTIWAIMIDRAVLLPVPRRSLPSPDPSSSAFFSSSSSSGADTTLASGIRRITWFSRRSRARHIRYAMKVNVNTTKVTSIAPQSASPTGYPAGVDVAGGEGGEGEGERDRDGDVCQGAACPSPCLVVFGCCDDGDGGHVLSAHTLTYGAKAGFWYHDGLDVVATRLCLRQSGRSVPSSM